MEKLKSMNTAIIGAGSNINPQLNIKAAKNLLSGHFNILAESHFVTTKPIGDSQQPNFINGSILISTGKTLQQLKSILKKIEAILGRRDSSNKFGPRTIDLDILVWNEKVVDKDFYARDFVKKSVLELYPDLKY